ncbi:MAG: excinuclease ABC subunit B, partial [Gammaproteobacteria bacterium HGW-Gammaproteobacteria-10]
KITRSMQQAIDETVRRREKQSRFNEMNNITPATVFKSVKDILEIAIPGTGFQPVAKAVAVTEPDADYKAMTPKQKSKKLKQMEEQMYKHARNLEFEEAARLRDEIKLLQEIYVSER